MVVRIELPSSLVAVMVASPIGALSGFRMIPAIVPNVVCAFEAAAESNSAVNIKDVRFVIGNLVVEKFDSSWSQMQIEQSQQNIYITNPVACFIPRYRVLLSNLCKKA